MAPENPVIALRNVMAEKGWNQVTFAKHLGIAPSGLSMILNGDRQLTPGVILKLGALTNTPAQIWAERANAYSIWVESPEGQRALKMPSQGQTVQPVELPATSDLFPIGLMVDHQIEQAREMKLLDINPFISNLLQSASYDFRLGTFITKDQRVVSNSGNVVKLHPGETAVVQSLESVTLSERIAGRVAIPTSLVMESIFMSYALQVDPGYSGSLFGCIKNEGRDPYELKIHDSVIFSVEFHRLGCAPKRKFGELRAPETLPAFRRPSQSRLETN